MERSVTFETDVDAGIDELTRVHDWRAEQLRRLGLPHVHAELFADLVDWHAVADLIRRGCAPALALKILR
jgi:hypothetical protein